MSSENSDLGDSGWIALNTVYGVYYRKKCGWITVSMSTNLDTAIPVGDLTLGTLPVEYRPSREVLTIETNTNGYLYIKESGDVVLRVYTPGQWNYVTAVYPSK